MIKIEDLQILYENLSKNENIRIVVDAGWAVLMRKDSDCPWRILNASGLLKEYSKNPDIVNCEVRRERSKYKIGFVDKHTGNLKYLMGMGIQQLGVRNLKGEAISEINEKLFLGVISGGKYVKFPSCAYTIRDTIYDHDLNKIAHGTLFKRRLRIKQIQHIYIIDYFYVLVTHAPVEIMGDSIKIGDDPNIYSLFTNEQTNENGALMSEDLTRSIPLTSLHTYSVAADINSMPVTFRGLVVSNYSWYHYIYNIDGVWIGDALSNSECYALNPYKPGSGLRTKPAAAALIED